MNEINELKSWLVILVNTYKENPSSELAKIINYYIDRILSHEDFELLQSTNCQYFTMRRYWRWAATIKKQ